MKEIRLSLNKRFRTLIPKVKAAHFRVLTSEQVEGQVLYMLKAPVNEYRIYPKMRTVTNRDTGEITKEPTGRFKSNKYQLGPGELVRMANLMAGKSLDKLSFAAGEGKAVLEQINIEARAAERASDALERAREASRPRKLPLRHGRRR